APPAGSGKFTVNFTLTNLPYSSGLRNPSSAKFSATARVLTALVSVIYSYMFFLCDILLIYILPNLPAQKDEGTGVDAVCTYARDAASQFDRVTVYHEVSNKTNGITSFGIYSLDQESLYING
ncbi:MUC16 protein, partial [Bucorvus abyssinicus]|nr:MUC16 protein [Bucorvus abyssinicus]